MSVGRYGRACSKEGIILGMNYVIFLSGNGERSRHGCASRAGLAAGGARGEALCPPGHVAGPRRIPGPQTAPRIWELEGKQPAAPLPSPLSPCQAARQPHLCRATEGGVGWIKGSSPAPPSPPGSPAGVGALRHAEHPKNWSKWWGEHRGCVPVPLVGWLKIAAGRRSSAGDWSSRARLRGLLAANG